MMSRGKAVSRPRARSVETPARLRQSVHLMNGIIQTGRVGRAVSARARVRECVRVCMYTCVCMCVCAEQISCVDCVDTPRRLLMKDLISSAGLVFT